MAIDEQLELANRAFANIGARMSVTFRASDEGTSVTSIAKDDAGDICWLSETPWPGLPVAAEEQDRMLAFLSASAQWLQSELEGADAERLVALAQAPLVPELLHLSELQNASEFGDALGQPAVLLRARARAYWSTLNPAGDQPRPSDEHLLLLFECSANGWTDRRRIERLTALEGWLRGASDSHASLLLLLEDWRQNRYLCEAESWPGGPDIGDLMLTGLAEALLAQGVEGWGIRDAMEAVQRRPTPAELAKFGFRQDP